MGIGGISIWQLLIILAIVLLLFGTKRLRNLGGDLGGAVKGFKSAMREGEAADDQPADSTSEASISQQDATETQKSDEASVDKDQNKA